MGQSGRETIGDGQAGGTTTDDDEVIFGAKLASLSPGKVGDTGKGLNEAQDGRARGKCCEKTHCEGIIMC